MQPESEEEATSIKEAEAKKAEQRSNAAKERSKVRHTHVDMRFCHGHECFEDVLEPCGTLIILNRLGDLAQDKATFQCEQDSSHLCGNEQKYETRGFSCEKLYQARRVLATNPFSTRSAEAPIPKILCSLSLNPCLPACPPAFPRLPLTERGAVTDGFIFSRRHSPYQTC